MADLNIFGIIVIVSDKQFQFVFAKSVSAMRHTGADCWFVTLYSRQNLLCDVILVADDVEIQAHKSVLAACSPYFYAMFTSELAEAKAEKIVLQEMDGKGTGTAH